MKKLSFPAAAEDYHEAKKEDLLYMLNQSTKELVGALADSLKPSGATTVVLSGCRIIDSETSVEIEAGYIYHNGEIYRVLPSSFVFPGGLDPEENPLEHVWLVSDEQDLDDADRVYRDGRTHRVFVETAMALSGSSSGAFFRLDALSYFANTAPKGTIRFWRPPAGVTLADVCRLPSGKGKGEFLGWQLVGDSGGRTILGMNWDESAVADVRDDTDYQNINEKGGKKAVTLTKNQSGAPDRTASSVLAADVMGDTIVSSGVWEPGANGHIVNRKIAGTDASAAHENRMPYMMAYIWEKI